ncbi:alkaline phosphatase [Psychrosphaera aestuarii]|nr:alkaline phosphatase [Psychrosphaera aestuarii]
MKNHVFTTLFKIAAVSLTLTSCFAAANVNQPKNIIFMIGDGMGVAHTTSYRYFSDNKSTKVVERTVFDELLVGTAATYPDDNTYVTDSAASATALSSGIKSYNGAIGVDVNKKPVLTLLERAKQLGKTTAIVSSSQINHATPASFMAHNESRKNYNEIANAYIDEKINGKPKADLMLGGGTSFFIRDDRNIVNEFKSIGYNYIDKLEDLSKLNSLPALGLFAPVGLPFAIDNKELPNRVTAMTKVALELLATNSSEKGFFAMIEGSQIDWCAHANDISCAIGELHDFSEAIKYAKAFTEKHGDTLLIITADHSTGGLSIGANGTYDWKTDKVRQIKSSLAVIIPTFLGLDKDASASEVQSTWAKHVDFELSDAQVSKIQAALHSKLKKEKMTREIKAIINDTTLTGWTTGGHSAGDVQVFATGVNSQIFAGQQDNTDIAKKLFIQLNSAK